jgi:hypothetical protein
MSPLFSFVVPAARLPLGGVYMASSESSKNSAARAAVEKWLRAAFEKVTVLPPDSHAAWIFAAADLEDHKLLVFRPTNSPEIIQISGSLLIEEQHRQRFSLIDKQERHRHRRDLLMDLYRKEVLFEGVDDDPPERITVHSILFLENLDRNYFMDKCLKVQSTVKLTKQWLHRAIDEPFVKSESTIN